MKYKILAELSAIALEQTVQRHIKDGWVPIGGIAVIMEQPATPIILYQAMTLEDKGGNLQ